MIMHKISVGNIGVRRSVGCMAKLDEVGGKVVKVEVGLCESAPTATR